MSWLLMKSVPFALLMRHHPAPIIHMVFKVNLVEWIKFMVGSRRSEELIDPSLEAKPSSKVLKMALLAALRCVDPDSGRRPKMSQVVRLLEAEEYPFREERRNRRNSAGGSLEISMDDDSRSVELEKRPEAAPDGLV